MVNILLICIGARWLRRCIHLPFWRLKAGLFRPTTEPSLPQFSLDTLPQEYPAFGNGDFRSPGYQIRSADGTMVTDFVFDSHEIFQGKHTLGGLPSAYVEDNSDAETLVLTLVDSMLGIGMNLHYTIYRDFDVITRSVSFEHLGSHEVEIHKCMSMSVDIHQSDWDWLHLYGTWGRERHIERQPLNHGIQTISSARGSSSHQHNPFVALLSKDTNEEYGDVFGICLVYSGNFQASIEVDPYQTSRLSIGINPFDFTWVLNRGKRFKLLRL